MIDMMNCTGQTPALAYLMNYDSVMVWSLEAFQNNTLLGDVLADYVDSGGTVVATYGSFEEKLHIAGRLRDSNYLPFTSSSKSAKAGQYQLVAVNRYHPLLNGVNSFDGIEFSIEQYL